MPLCAQQAGVVMTEGAGTGIITITSEDVELARKMAGKIKAGTDIHH